MGKIKIGYMGAPYSYSCEMARILVSKTGMDAELVPLIGAAGVVEALEEKKVGYGVLAYRSNTLGQMAETRDAVRGKVFEVVSKGELPVHICLFAASGGTEIRTVSSHAQVLRQCGRNLFGLYPEARTAECPDTAVAARMLAEGRLPKDTAVLCSRPAGEHWNLHLVHENIEDRKDNLTEFVMVRLPNRGRSYGRQ